MKLKLFTSIFMTFLISSLMTSCRPEQEMTEFNVTATPKPGQTIKSVTLEDEPILITYEVDEDEEASDELTFDLVEEPKNGKLIDCKYLNPRKWQCTYVPNENFFGSDKIAFKTKDGDFSSKEKSYIEISITSVPDLPVAGDNQEFTLIENHDVSFSINGGADPDTDSSELEYIIVKGPENGEMINCFNSDKRSACTYKPTAEYIGDDQITYKVVDKENKSSDKFSSATVKFVVLKEMIPVNGISSIKVIDKKSNVLIVFALDTSGSMVPYIDHMKKSVLNFVDDITARGFKANLAFINSDAAYKIEKTNLAHPVFPDVVGAKIVKTDYMTLPSSVKIFEIDAYDAGWNADTVSKIALTKKEIETFINELPKGNDDERLLCSTVRFMNSEFTKNMDYVGLFSLANEDDAVNLKTVQAAYSGCIDNKTTEYKPINECTKKAACSYGEEGCVGKFTYKWTHHYTQNISSRLKGTCEKMVNDYVKEDQTWATGYIVKTKYKTQSVEVCEEKYKNADNPSGCIFQNKSVADGTYNQTLYRKGSCEVNSTLLNCSTYVKSVNVYVGKKKQKYSCTKYGGTCNDHPEIIEGCYIDRNAYVANKTTTKTKYDLNQKSCLEVTGVAQCLSMTWAGQRSYTTEANCGVKAEPTKTNYYEVSGAQSQSLALSISDNLKKKFKKSVYIAVANDKALNEAALIKAEAGKLALPSVDCNSYLANRELYAGTDGVQFKALAGLMGDTAQLFSICSPDKYPSEKLDYLVEESQLDFKIEEFETTYELKVEEVRIVYASAKEVVVKKEDFSFEKGHVILLNPLLAKNLVEVKITFSGYEL